MTMASVRQENRWRKTLHEANSAINDRQREIELLGLVRLPRPALKPIAKSDTRIRVRRWMGHCAGDYDTATELAEAANIALNLPEGARDDETHWIWEEAFLAMED